eukprot:5858374-Pleurochrysis_carterae.AAC.1
MPAARPPPPPAGHAARAPFGRAEAAQPRDRVPPSPHRRRPAPAPPLPGLGHRAHARDAADWVCPSAEKQTWRRGE